MLKFLFARRNLPTLDYVRTHAVLRVEVVAEDPFFGQNQNLKRINTACVYLTINMRQCFLSESFFSELADGRLLVVAGNVMPDYSIGVEVIEHSDAQLGLAVVPELVAVVGLRLALLVTAKTDLPPNLF